MVNLSEQFTVREHLLSTKSLHYRLLRLDYLLREHQIPQLRRFVNLFVGQDNDLFHNHRDAHRYHYRYPLVQYKTDEGKAAVLGMGDAGMAAIGQLAAHTGFRDRCAEWLGDGSIWQEEHTEDLVLTNTAKTEHRLENYLALNEANYSLWQQNPSLVFRASLLERCLTGHILKFATAIRWQLPPRSLQVELLDYRTYPLRLFDATLMGFDVLFRTNITLPEGIGLGKAVSHGFGQIKL